MAGWDRVIRILVGIVFIYLWIVKDGSWWITGIIGIVFLITSLIGFCPLYRLLGFKTKRD